MPARAGVRHAGRDRVPGRVPPGRQAEGPARRHGLDGVGRQVAEDLQQGRRGHRHRRQARIEVDLDPDPLRLGRAGGQPGGLGQDGVQVAGGQVLGVGPRELEEPRDDLLEAIDLVDQAAERLLVETDDAALPELGRRADAGQRVADLVGDARQQLAQRRQPLAPPQLGLEPVPLDRLSADRPRQAGGQQRTPGRSPPGPAPRPAGSPGASGRRTAGRPAGSSPRWRRRRVSASTTTGAVRIATVTGRSPSSSSTENSDLLLADRGVDLDVDQVGLERRQARLPAGGSPASRRPDGAASPVVRMQQDRAQEALEAETR